MIKILKNRKRGFALLFAVFTASILLLIGVSIFNVSLRELAISQSAKDSQLAFYAADSARECALYWDIKQAAFPFCLGDACTPKNEGKDTIICGTMTFQPKVTSVYDGAYTYTFSASPFFKYGDDTQPMADLTLIKKFDSHGLVGGTGDVISTLDIQGHNTGPSGRRVERGIYQTY